MSSKGSTLSNLVEGGEAPREWVRPDWRIGTPPKNGKIDRRDSLARELFSEFVLAPEWQHLSYKEMARQAREAAEAFE